MPVAQGISPDNWAKGEKKKHNDSVPGFLDTKVLQPPRVCAAGLA